MKKDSILGQLLLSENVVKANRQHFQKYPNFITSILHKTNLHAALTTNNHMNLSLVLLKLEQQGLWLWSTRLDLMTRMHKGVIKKYWMSLQKSCDPDYTTKRRESQHSSSASCLMNLIAFEKLQLQRWITFFFF